jgi:hypothetical protein
MDVGDKIQWLKVWGDLDQPDNGEIGTVTEGTDGVSPLFLVTWEDGSTSVESEQDRHDYWEQVK